MMALPKLNSAPKYELTIPSTGAPVRYRPFLVKEEKNLMIASESGDPKNVFKALIDTIGACIDGEFNTRKLTSFDVEYMFLQMRSKSVGESTKIGLRCSECDATNEQVINLDQINVTVPKIDTTIELTDNIKIEVGYPTFDSIIESGINEGQEANTEQAFALIRSCLLTIITDEERINLSEVTQEELQDFLDSMSSTQFEKIKEFVDGIPKLQHEVDFTCNKCGHENKLTIEGVANFLS
tara:strand:+ start:4843 stop:5559 length:717 start_codon:yes stop_codon:yes gene_type:complete